MSFLPRPSSPRAALSDLIGFMRHRRREQWIGLALAVIVTAGIVVLFIFDAKTNTAPPPTVVYVDSWSENRTDAEIVADQKKDQAAREAAQQERQRQFQKLEKRFGIE
jgi:hypothetical protein